MRRACRSVLATMNSMPSTPASIMRLTALPPPPPTPMTLILASLRGSSLKLMRMSFSVFFISAALVFIGRCGSMSFSPTGLVWFRLLTHGLRLGLDSGAALRLGPLRHSLWDLRRSQLHPYPRGQKENGNATDLAASRSLPYQHGFEARAPAIVLDAAGDAGAISVTGHAQDGGELGLGQGFGHPGQRRRPGQTQRTAQDRISGVENAGQARGAAAEHEAGHAHFEHAGVPQVVTNHDKEFVRARFEDFSHHALGNQPRGPVADRGHLHFVAFRNQGDDGMAVKLLDFFGLRDRGAESHRKVAGEVVASDGDDSGVGDGAVLKYDETGGTGADIDEADPEFALVGAQNRVGAGQRLIDGVINPDAGAVNGGDHVLRGAGSGGDHVDAYFESRGHHAEGIMHPGLVVEDEFLGQQVQYFAIGGERDGAGLVDGEADFLAGNFPRAGSEANPAMGVHAADVRPGNTQQRVFDGGTQGVFGLLDGLLDGSNRLVEIDDDAFAGAARVGDAVSPVAQAMVGDFHDQRAGLGATYIDRRQ